MRKALGLVTSPRNREGMAAPANVPLSATVSPAMGIASVQFLNGTNPVGIVTERLLVPGAAAGLIRRPDRLF
jgi:hypothetical protein